MEHGDISNEVAPRLLVVFEGLVGKLPNKTAETKHAFHQRVHAWRRAARCWELDPLVAKRFWDMSFRLVQTLDVVTFLPMEEADYIKERLDERGYPYGNLWATDEEELLREILPNPAVIGVIDPDPGRQWTYGAKGGFVWM